MSDQTSPADQPTPPPAEGAGDGIELGKTAPPPPPDDTNQDTAPPPPPEPPKKSRKGLLIGLIAGFVVLAVLAAVAIVLVVTKGEDEHSITIASTAGGMKRDKAPEEEPQAKQQFDAIAKQLETQFKGTSVTYGLYNQSDSDRGPKGKLLFVGFKFTKPSDKNPANFVDQLSEVGKTNQLKVTNISTGDAGGKGVCLATPSSAAQKNASCFWVTRDSAGGLIPTAQGYDSKQISKILLDLRSDVEKTE